MGDSVEVLPPQVAAVVARVPLWRGTSVHVEPLAGVISLNNTNYRVTTGGETYVLRIATPTAHHLGIRRDQERKVTELAAQAGLAPEVLYFDDEGNAVTHFVRGRHWQQSDFHDTSQQARLVTTMRRLRSITGTGVEGSLFRRIDLLAESAVRLGQQLPPDFTDLQKKLHRLEAARAHDTRFRPGLCHNDLWSNNLLDDGENLWLLDWEFAGDGDPLADLAVLSLQAGFDSAGKAAFLQACGYEHPEDADTLDAMTFVVKGFEALWALTQQGLNRVGATEDGAASFDYAAHARQMFDALRDPSYDF